MVKIINKTEVYEGLEGSKQSEGMVRAVMYETTLWMNEK